MRFLDDDDIKKMEEDLTKFMKSYKQLPILQQKLQMPSLRFSPTDVDARGLYSYHEPEVDEQGTYYGYKVLHTCPDSQCRSFVSPRYSVHWDENGCLRADAPPGGNHMHGIHCTKSPDHPELKNYHPSYEYPSPLKVKAFVVKCALSGIVVETEQGFRAEHAQIIGVYEDGNWKSYQDYQERSDPNPYTNPYEEGYRWNTSTKGIWHASYFDPEADS